jgi:hypothetical protein
MTTRIKNWRKFQHFKNRRPPWIKLYRDLLDDPDWHDLDPAAAKFLVMLWLLASEDEKQEGGLPDLKTIAFRLRLTEKEAKQRLSQVSNWLDQDDITTISPRYHDGPPETETETELEHDASHHWTTDKEPIGEHPRARLFRKGKTLLVSLGVSERQSGAVIGRWLKQKNDPVGILAALQYAADHGIIEPIGYVTRCLSKEIQMENLALATDARGLPSKQEKSKMQLALDARLLPSEAIAGFAHKGQADDGYITTIANVLVRYPRSVAIKCAHPIDGVVRQTKFLPTPSDIIDWCEAAALPLREAADRENRIEQQLKARDEWNAPRTGPRKTAAEILKSFEDAGFEFAGRKKRITVSRDEFVRRYGISERDFDALPSL